MKPQTKIRLNFLLWDCLDLLEDALFLASRPGMGRMQRYWGYTETRSAFRQFERWEAERYLIASERGKEVCYKLGPAAEQFLGSNVSSASLRRRKWDRRWRMVMFDFPEVARKARDAFRRELRLHRMGCLQKSVWITPDPVIPAWKKLLAASELTDWVLLFESAELGPVEDVEIAGRVWRLDEVSSRYERYMSAFKAIPSRLRAAHRTELPGELSRMAHRESRAYFELLQADPMLPAMLLPKAAQPQPSLQRIHLAFPNRRRGSPTPIVSP